MYFIPVFVDDLKEPLQRVPVHDQHANPGAKQHRLDQIRRNTLAVAMGDRILEVIDGQNIFRLLTVRTRAAIANSEAAKRFILARSVLPDSWSKVKHRSMSRLSPSTRVR